MAVERIVGIDFGTSTSVIRVKRYKDGAPVGGDKLSTESVIFNGSYPVVPTLIQKLGEATYYGYDAQVPKKKAVLHQGFKVDLESADPKRREEARALTQEFLTYLAGIYRSQSDGGHLGEADDQVRTIISYPVKWSDETKDFMVEAAKKAGFSNVEGMDEAQAAIHAVTMQSEDYLKKQGYLKPGVPCTMLLIDMGAGTTDLVLCRYTPGEHPKMKVLATWPTKGDTLFGGQEVERLLADYVKEKLPGEEVGMLLERSGSDKFKTWKEKVVSPVLQRDGTVESFADLDMIVEALGLDMEPYHLNRSTFEKSAKAYLREFPELVRGCIEAAGIEVKEVELVILTGGHSQWYFVKEMLAGEKPEFCEALLPKIQKDPGRIIPVSRPQETVALGLAYLPPNAEPEPEVAERKILFLGGFCVGKSTLINAMLHEDLLPADALPCTSMVTRISYGMDKKVRIQYQDGTQDQILSREEWSKTTLDDAVNPEYLEGQIRKMREAILHSEKAPEGVCMVDTPGLESNGLYDIYKELRSCDIIVFVINACMAFTSVEVERIKKLLEPGYKKEKIWFVFTYMDVLRHSDVERVKKAIHNKLSFVYEDENGCFDEDLYSRRVFFVSARDALNIRLGEKTDMTDEETGVPALERSIAAYREPEETAPILVFLVEDTCEIEGRGTVVTGIVHGQSLCVGEEVVWLMDEKLMKASVSGIERNRTLVQTANDQDAVGLLLRGVKEKEIRPGCVLTKV